MTVRLGILGLGRWGRTILKTLEKVPHARVMRVASNNPGSPSIIPAGCVVRTDWLKVVNAWDVEAVIIAAPAALHAEMVLASLEANKAVFVEKPLAMTVKDAEEATERSVGKILHVDHLDLFNPAWQAFAKHIGSIGEVVGIEASFGAKTDRKDISLLWDWSPHPVACCIDLMGEPNAVAARKDGNRLEIDLGFPTGAFAKIDVSTDFEPRQRKVSVYGSDGWATYDDNAKEKVVIAVTDPVNGDSDMTYPLFDPMPPLECALRRFVEAVRYRRASSDGKLGTAVVRVLTEIEKTVS